MTNLEKILMFALKYESNFIQAEDFHNEMELLERKSQLATRNISKRKNLGDTYRLPYPDICVWKCIDCGVTSERGIPEHIPEVDVRSWIDEQAKVETYKHNRQVKAVYLQRKRWWQGAFKYKVDVAPTCEITEESEGKE